MRRREFIAGLGGAVAWPIAAQAQQRTMPLVGFINGGSPDGYRYEAEAFRQGLKETGYVEGQNVAVEYRWAEGNTTACP
jgi:putative tryptophan/tyrosine transport system substrate-binding protein